MQRSSLVDNSTDNQQNSSFPTQIHTNVNASSTGNNNDNILTFSSITFHSSLSTLLPSENFLPRRSYGNFNKDIANTTNIALRKHNEKSDVSEQEMAEKLSLSASSSLKKLSTNKKRSYPSS